MEHGRCVRVAMLGALAAALAFTTQAASGGADQNVGGSGSSPSVRDLKLSPTSFQPASHGSRGHKQPATATTISFDLSQPASVTLGFQRATQGQLVGHRCVASSKKRRRARSCTRYVSVAGSLTIAGKAGVNRVVFKGALTGGRKLAPGSYRLVLAASNAAGRSAAAQQPNFTLLR